MATLALGFMINLLSVALWFSQTCTIIRDSLFYHKPKIKILNANTISCI